MLSLARVAAVQHRGAAGPALPRARPLAAVSRWRPEPEPRPGAGLSSIAGAMEDALDRVPQAILLVDGTARLLYANRAARAILAARDGLHAPPEGLRTDISAETEALRRLIRSAAGLSEAGEPSGALAVSRPSLMRPLAVFVAPSSAAGEPGRPRSAAAIVFISDPERVPSGAATLLRCLYRLTEAEAEVALAAVRGDGVQAIAARVGIRPSTARTHLQHVFEKTGTRRQAELVRLVLQSVVSDACGGAPAEA